MDDAELLDLSLTDLSWLIAARKVSAVEALQATLKRLKALDDKLNAFITVCAEPALADAKRADQEIAAGNYRGPLHGVPVSIKDMFEMSGVLTTGGSKILQDWVPDRDSTLVEKLARRRRGDLRQDQSRRVRPWRHFDTVALRPGA